MDENPEYGATLGMRQLHRICWYPIRALPLEGVNQGGTAGTKYNPSLKVSKDIFRDVLILNFLIKEDQS